MCVRDRNPGLYIHIPFCQSKCGYCDFFSVTNLRPRHRFISALLKEMELRANKIEGGASISSVYFGGGTPSVLDAEELEKIIVNLGSRFDLMKNSEITIEVNPGTVTDRSYHIYRKLGINRINLGIQSFSDADLRLLGRIHLAAQAERSYFAARSAGFTNIGVDLIYGIPGQSLPDWEESLKQCISLNPEHISVYNLTIEPGTPLEKALRRGKMTLPDEETEIAMFLSARNMLQIAGYMHYEVSNYARSEDFISQHNYKYWLLLPYLGFGPSAHSFWGGRRWSNISHIDGYCRMLETGRLPVVFTETLNNTEKMLEHIYLALRTWRGLNLKHFKTKFNCNFLSKYRKIINSMKQNRLVVVDKEYIRFTEEGMLISDELLSYFA